MNYTTVYVGMDVHKETFFLYCYTNEKEKPEYPQKMEAHYSKILNYLEAMRFHYGNDADFICGYETGCLSFTLYHQLTQHNVKCVILAPTTMAKPAKSKKIKTDKRDTVLIARYLAHYDYSAVHIPTEHDEQVKEYIRMRHNYCFNETFHHCTAAHLKWLRALKPGNLYQEILEEYLLTFDNLTDKLERLDKRIAELAADKKYKEKVSRLSCFHGIKK